MGDPSSWRWIGLDVILAIHDRQIAEHGGAEGIRDSGLIESALARPINATSYETPDAAGLAAAYAYGFIKNHAFADGNKRTAWIAARLFLKDNGYHLRFDPIDAIRTMEKAAAGEMSEQDLAQWFRDRLTSSS